MSIIFTTPPEAMKLIANQARDKRLSTNWSQKTLSDRSGVSLGVIKRFETSGKISLESLLKIALVLGDMESFLSLFTSLPEEQIASIDDIKEKNERLRGRK